MVYLISEFRSLNDERRDMIFLERPDDFSPKVEVVGCFIEYEDKILLLHRQDHKSQGNRWGIPAGKVEKNESVIGTAIRETLEETGFDISLQSIEHLHVVFIKDPLGDYIYHMVRCCTPCDPGSVRIDFKSHKGFTWVTPFDSLTMSLMDDEDDCIKLIYEENFIHKLSLARSKDQVLRR